MRTAGIVCEYNPFHNGHLDHLERVMKLPGSDYVVCVMSSDFLQRGEPAILPKEYRAEAAIRNGADLVVEIPVVFSCSSAEFYASAGVSLMARLGIVDSVVFGSENPDISVMKRFAEILTDEPPEFSLLLKEKLSEGVSFARARQQALVEFTEIDNAEAIIEGSNNILGIEYIKAILKNGYPIKPIAIPRIAEAYKQTYIEGRFPSATAIRRAILDEGLDSVRKFLPASTFDIMNGFYDGNKSFINIEILKEAIFYRIASLSADVLKNYPGVIEGLENRLKSNLDKASTLSEYIDLCATRRYPRTRISRTLVYILLDITSKTSESLWKKGPLYARLLAASEKGMNLVPVIERNSSIPAFTSFKAFYDNASEAMRTILDIEKRASDIYSTSAGLATDREYTLKFSIY
jgi:predicted nucleotidyltransferase